LTCVIKRKSGRRRFHKLAGVVRFVSTFERRKARLFFSQSEVDPIRNGLKRLAAP